MTDILIPDAAAFERLERELAERIEQGHVDDPRTVALEAALLAWRERNRASLEAAYPLEMKTPAPGGDIDAEVGVDGVPAPQTIMRRLGAPPGRRVTVAGRNRRRRVIPRAEVEDRLENDRGVAVVEVTDLPDFAAGHLPGAVLAPLDPRFDATMLEQLPRLDQTVVVYGRGNDGEAATAATRLATLGYREVLHYDGGKRDWRAAGQPLETGSQPLRPGP